MKLKNNNINSGLNNNINYNRSHNKVNFFIFNNLY